MSKSVTRIRGRLAAIAANPEGVRREVRKAMEAAAEDIVQQMRRLAPKDSGDLARSIGWTWGAPPGGTIRVTSIGGDPDMTITVYAGGKVGSADAFYARFQEFGTRKMPANPFFFPTWRQKKRSVRAKLAGAVRRGLKAKA